MEDFKLFDAENKFLNLIWDCEPINSTELTKICEEKLGWKKSTTYTMIRKLIKRSILQSENAVVTALVKRQEVQRYESETVLEKSFDNSLPAFVAAFLKDNKLTEAEACQLKAMIEEARK